MATKKDRAEALARMTKAELIKTVKTLDSRVTKLLNQIERGKKEYNSDLRTAMDVGAALTKFAESANPAGIATVWLGERPRMPWEDALSDTTAYAPSSGQPIKRGE